MGGYSVGKVVDSLNCPDQIRPSSSNNSPMRIVIRSARTSGTPGRRYDERDCLQNCGPYLLRETRRTP
jgi:hypothetical protein